MPKPNNPTLTKTGKTVIDWENFKKIKWSKYTKKLSAREELRIINLCKACKKTQHIDYKKKLIVDMGEIYEN